MGKSGSGKDTVKNILMRNTKISFCNIVEATDRPRRPNEPENSKLFLSQDNMNNLLSSNGAIECRSYNVATGETWRYATVNISPKDNNNIYLGIGTLESYKCLLNKYGHSIVKPIYIEVEDSERLVRAIRRDGKNNTRAHKETCRRFLSDCDDFSKEKLDEVGITSKVTFNNKDSISSTCDRILAYILKNTKEERLSK